MPYGYNGRTLRVNLSTGAITVEEPSEAVYRRYLGGSALAAYYLLKEVPAGIDPLGPENKLLFMTSVINGTNISGVNRWELLAELALDWVNANRPVPLAG
jgi:aldehyde:ferredoxin oxidoreductase